MRDKYSLLVFHAVLVTLCLLLNACDYFRERGASPALNVPLSGIIYKSAPEEFLINFKEMVLYDCFFKAGDRTNRGPIAMEEREDLEWLELGLGKQMESVATPDERKGYLLMLNRLFRCRHIFPRRSVTESAYLSLLKPDVLETVDAEIMVKEIQPHIEPTDESPSEIAFRNSAWLLLHQKFAQLRDSPDYTVELMKLRSYLISSLLVPSSESEAKPRFCWDMMQLAYLGNMLSADTEVGVRLREMTDGLISLLNTSPETFPTLEDILPCVAGLRVSADSIEAFASSQALNVFLEKYLIHQLDGIERYGCARSQWFLSEFRPHAVGNRICHKNPRFVKDNAWLYLLLSDLPEVTLAVNEKTLEKIGMPHDRLITGEWTPPAKSVTPYSPPKIITLHGLFSKSQPVPLMYPQSTSNSR